MGSDKTKSFHLFFFAIFAFLFVVIILFVYLGVNTLLIAISLGMEDPDFFLMIYFSCGYGVVAISVILILVQFVKGYLDEGKLDVQT